MSEKDFMSSINVLDNLHEMEALIDAERLEYLSENGSWVKLNIEGLKYVPVSLYPGVSIDKESGNIIYKIKYDLLIPHIRLIPSNIESFILSADYSKEKPYMLSYKTDSNEEYDSDSVYVRYNNEDINILSKIKNNTMILDYKMRNRKKLHQALQAIDQSINNSKVKQK